MAQPGWYPDPSGSGQPRYWDGQAWSSSPGQATPADGGNRKGLWSLLAGVLAVALVVVVIIWQPWRSPVWGVPPDTNSQRPTGTQWNELSPTETPTTPQPTDDGGRPVECPLATDETRSNRGDWYTSGSMQYRGVPRWRDGGGWAIDFTWERSGQQDRVADGWVAITAIGQTANKDFSPDPRATAGMLFDCMSTSYYYRTLDHRERLQDEAFTTSDGVQGWIIRENFWNVPGQPVSGDEVVVAVVNGGDKDRLVMFHSQAPIEDPERKAKVAAALDSLRRS